MTERNHLVEEKTEGEYLNMSEASSYLRTCPRKLGLLVKHGLLRYAKPGKNYLFRKCWLDECMETWSGYDLGTEEKIRFAVESRRWEEVHGKVSH